MKEKKKNILIEIIIIIMIVLLIILTIINIISLNNMKFKKNEQSHSEQISLDKIDTNLVRPQYSVYFFSKYTGQHSQEEIIRALDKFTIDLIPKYYSNIKLISDDVIHKYYIENKLESNIEGTNVAMKNEDVFKQFLKKLNNLKGTDLKFEKFKFERDSINNETDGVSATISISYINNDEIKLNVLVKNKKSDNGIIIEVCE